MVVQCLVIEIRNLCKSFSEREILRDFSILLPDGCITGLFGRSGVGKSTLAKLLCGILRPDAGEILLDGKVLVSSVQPYDRRQGLTIQMVYQQPYATLDPSQRLEYGFRELIHYHRLAASRVETDALIDATLAQLNLERSLLQHLPRQISGGEAQRVAIARCLLLRPKLLILDEATSMLDVSTQANVLGAVRRAVQAIGGSILLISHDRVLTDFFCDRVVIFEHQTIKE